MNNFAKLGAIAGCLVCTLSATAGENIAVAWNRTVLEIAEAEDGFLTLKGVRTAAMMHLAMHDALNAAKPRYVPYAYRLKSNANAADAANIAAYEVAVSQYPDQEDKLAELRDAAGSAARPETAQDASRLGKAAAGAVLTLRENDGWDTEAEYRWHPMAPGVYAEFEEHSNTPKGFIFGAGWAQAKGFALSAPDEFRMPPPPAIGSHEYTEAYDEVRTVGRFQTLHRTPDQTHLALWWKDFAESSHNRLARDLIAKENLTLHESARLLALINMGIFDAYVASFDNKFYYNHWRPYTAIRWARHDGNDATKPEPTWTNTHQHTYAFPSYPSAHGTACAAAMSAFENVFGRDYAFTMTTPKVDIAGPFSGKIAMHPPQRHFDSFAKAADECGLSRVYLGIQFRYDSEQGVALGRLVGAKVVDNFLQPLYSGPWPLPQRGRS
jgi:hypothetical protein